ncbi:glycosyltransferase [Maribacter polysiphoniae]|uniref:glycosyltransferase n=1 Tax=Maribacter polysiphoniae TaxID=429344 RepID=UPI002357FCD9|nr:glycosyltransferase [Maribacter polysiphoniae]
MGQQQLLIIGYTWPEPSTTAAGNRMLQLIRFFLEHDYKITFASTASHTEHSLNLNTLGVVTQDILLNDSGFNVFVKNLDPKIVLFDRYLTEEQFGWRVAETVPNALRILDTEDLHSLRAIREQCFKSNVEFNSTLWLASDMTKREVASIYRCDLSLIISTFEMDLLTAVIKMDESLLLHLPFQLETIEKENALGRLPFNARKDFICMGNGKHAPNMDAVVWLKSEIWPLIRKALPKAELHIHGAYLPAHIKQMHKPETGFLVKGWAKEVQEVMGNSRVNLAPLRFGAGIKGKLIDAMLYGTPSVTTTIGAEGMNNDLPWNGQIANSAEEIAKSAIALYNNESEWLQAQQNGFGIIDTYYNKESHDKNLADTLDALHAHLEEHRTNNFIGAMVRHQSMASTKYLSKWIEEKNK